MRYEVLPLRSRRTGDRPALPISWQVVDVDAGINARAYPNKIVASCRDESQAQRICDMFNGIGVYPDNIEAVRAERERAIKQREIALEERDLADIRWQATLSHANRQTAEARTTLQKWQDKCTALMADLAGERDRADRLQADFDEADKKLGEIYDILEGAK